MNSEKSINNMIMRRVYYSFALSIVESATFWQGIALGGSIAAFGRLTHVASLYNNVLAVPVGDLPAHVWQSVAAALRGGEVLTVLVTALMVGLAVTFLHKAWIMSQRPSSQMA